MDYFVDLFYDLRNQFWEPVEDLFDVTAIRREELECVSESLHVELLECCQLLVRTTPILFKRAERRCRPFRW